MGDSDPLLAFNKKLTFKTALTWDPKAIHTFLNNVVADPDSFRERDPADPTKPYPDPNPKRRKDDLRLLRDEIIALAPPDGLKYATPTPPQSILRAGGQLAPTQNIPWPVNNEAERFFATFDLLGMFLSLIGPAPTTGAKTPTAQNFFLPLDIMYGKWCITLVTGSGLTPNKAQITWASQDDGHPYFFFLGANARGWSKKKTDIDWQLLVQSTRHQYMTRILEPKWHERGVSPAFNKYGKSGWNYGNCAETYPFLYLIANGFPAARISGVSLNIPYVKTHTDKWTKYWDKDVLEPPCPNCEELIKYYGAILGNFKPWEPSKEPAPSD